MNERLGIMPVSLYVASVIMPITSLSCYVQESLFFVTEAMTVFQVEPTNSCRIPRLAKMNDCTQWSRASDHIGRKPILLIGLAGSMISMLLFGLSKTFWALVIRCASQLSYSIIQS